MKTTILLTIYAHLVCFSLSAQSMLTVGEVYDFDIGDEFHYTATVNEIGPYYYHMELLGGYFHSIRMKIDDKHYSSNSDTLFYTRSFNNYRRFAVGSPTQLFSYFYTIYSDTVYYTNLDSNVNYRHVNFTVDSCNMYSDTLFQSQQFCNRELYNINVQTGDCFHGLSSFNSYGEGLGDVMLDYVVYSEQAYIRKDLVYYKKLNQTCGLPDLVDIDDVSMPNLLVYPNPATNSLFISNIQSENEIKLYDMYGKLIIQTKAINECTLDISQCKPGAYILSIGNYKKRIIKN